MTREDLERLERELPVLMSERHVAEVLGVSTRTIQRWVAAGELAAPIKLGDGDSQRSRKRYGRSAVLALIAKAAGLVLVVADLLAIADAFFSM
jgi:excisionase family DNA binding protein